MKEKNKIQNALVKEIHDDFKARQEMRRELEAKWLLNINFMLGNQHAVIAPNSDIIDYGKQYYWQEREVYNHIAPIVESRLAKFTRVNCALNVRPASGSDGDINVAKLSAKLIESTQLENNFVAMHAQANYWAELTGTVFYKVLWNKRQGKILAKDEEEILQEGDVKLSYCPPYEIYPDSLACPDVSACRSIMHARAYPVKTIQNVWGVTVEGGEVSVISMDTVETGGGARSAAKGFRVCSETKEGHAVVLERYELPSREYPEGRLSIVAGDALLYDGILPYKNGADGARGFPFIRQVALEQPASFYGASVIERLIPVQRAYNAVKNRKHEFLNRLSAGVVAVEEGSVDIDGLEEEGLSPGKLLVYRQGATPPRFMNPGTVPAEFRDEEDRLLQEFISISGVSNYASQASLTSNAISGYALSLLLEQDYSRLSVTTESMRGAVREMAKQILRLYRQFAKSSRMVKISGENGSLEIASFLGSELTSDDIVMEADSEMVETPAVRKGMVMDLLKSGLLADENGNISNRNKLKVLEMLGFGNWESAKSTEEAHLKKAALENADMEAGKDPGIEEVDEHALHTEEHTRFLVAGRDTLTDSAKQAINAHIREHKAIKRLAGQAAQAFRPVAQ